MLTIYGYVKEVNSCIGCESAKRLLTSRGMDFEFISIANKVDGNVVLDEAVVSELRAKLGTDRLTAPIIFEGEQYIGGFEELRRYIKK